MQIILLDKVVNLGNLGEIVKVKDGYARNFLIPSGRARRATESAIKEFEVRRAELEKAAAAKLAAAQAQGEKLGGTSIKLSQKAGVDGRLFGSVTNFDIADELIKAAVGAFDRVSSSKVTAEEERRSDKQHQQVYNACNAHRDRYVDSLEAQQLAALIVVARIDPPLR